MNFFQFLDTINQCPSHVSQTFEVTILWRPCRQDKETIFGSWTVLYQLQGQRAIHPYSRKDARCGLILRKGLFTDRGSWSRKSKSCVPEPEDGEVSSGLSWLALDLPTLFSPCQEEYLALYQCPLPGTQALRTLELVPSCPLFGDLVPREGSHCFEQLPSPLQQDPLSTFLDTPRPSTLLFLPVHRTALPDLTQTGSPGRSQHFQVTSETFFPFVIQGVVAC